MNIRDLMTRDVARCQVNDTLNRAAQLMWDSDCGCVPVVDDGGRLQGVVTDRDVCMAAYTQGRTLREISVESAMSRDPLTCSPMDSVESAQALMELGQVRRIPVMDQGKLAGMVSLSDIVRSLPRQGMRSGASRSDGLIETLLRIFERRSTNGGVVPQRAGRAGNGDLHP